VEETGGPGVNIDLSQVTDTVEHKYTKAKVFLNNWQQTKKKTTKNMKYTSATQFDICQMTNRTDLYNNWTSI
jgi:hypothetical protein